MYSKILVGVDASENSTRALQVAAELSKHFGAELHVFHAVSHHFQMPVIAYPASGLASINIGDLAEYYKQAGQAVLDDAKNYIEGLEFVSDIVVEYHLEVETAPSDFAVDFAADQNVDLIVVGCKGHHGA